jgi:hypothetical protein
VIIESNVVVGTSLYVIEVILLLMFFAVWFWMPNAEKENPFRISDFVSLLPSE